MDRVIVAVACAALLVSGPAFAQGEEPELGWADEAELSFVATDGNSKSESLGFKNELSHRWEDALFRFRAGGIRVETTTLTLTAPGPGTVIETESSATTAENYFANTRYNREVTERFFWYVGAGWERNEFAGIENRWVGEGGLGHVWLDSEEVRFETAYAATYTDQEDVVPDPLVDDTFFGARLSWDYENALTATTTYDNILVLDFNLDEGDDWRGDMINSIAVTMSKKLALKASLQWLFDNQPAIVLVPRTDDPLAPPVRFERDELDTLLTTSLVLTF
jgi:hypothetical protein